MEQKSSDPRLLAEQLLNFSLSLYVRMKEHPLPGTDLKLSSHGFHILYILNESPDGTVPMTELVSRLGRTRQQLSKLISDLEDDGLVTRVHTSENRRLVYVSLTDAGKETACRSRRNMTDAVEQALRTIPEERLEELDALTSQLADLGIRINQYLQEVSDERSTTT